jgi:hypothetical protein
LYSQLLITDLKSLVGCLRSNIAMDFREIGWGGMDWIHLAQYRDQWWALAYAVMNVRVP